MNAALPSVVDQVRTRSSSLANQIERAAMSVALNLGEGRRRRGKDRIHHFRVAAGSADETATAIRVAVAWKMIGDNEGDEVLAYVDRILAMTWRLTNKR